MKKGTYIRTEEVRKKQSQKMTGIKMPPRTEIHRNKLSESGKGKIKTQEHRNNLSEARKKQEIPSGKDHWNWKGGIGSIYPKEFSRELKIKIRTRDNFTCCLCKRTEREELEELNRVLCVNHIDFNKENCKESNLNTLCLRCNTRINRDREYWTNYFQQ